MAARIGKQALCPCKSGLKFGDCHGMSPAPFQNRLDEIQTDPNTKPTWEAMTQAGIPFHGVHPSILIDGKRIRFIGDRLFIRPPSQTFHEFLLGFLRSVVVGKSWLERQNLLPVGKQHHLSRWFMSEREFMQPHRAKAIADRQTHFRVDAPGEVSDLLTLAHDVFHLVNAGSFHTKLRRRLLDKKEFQGVRYEIAVAALATRAGMKVKFVHHPEKKHHDFLASDQRTQTTVAFEAKSRHRAGGLHEPGSPDENRIKRGDVASLIGQALDQNPGDIPFIIFVDINVPRELGIRVEERPWFNDVWTDMQSLGEPTPDHPDEFSAIFLTNFWHAWSEATLSSGPEYLHIISHHSRHPIPVYLVGRLMASVQNYSFVPPQV